MKILNNNKFIKSPFIKGDVRRTGGLKGFSFIELIVVVTIIAVMSVIGVISFGGVNRRSRDSRRISDLEKMRISLEMIRQVGRTYPASSAALAPNYIQTLPVDPKTKASYTYAQLSGGYQYTIVAILEDAASAETGTTRYTVNSP